MTTVAGVRGLSVVGGTGGAIGFSSSTSRGVASRVLAQSGGGSDLPTTGIAIGGTLLLAAGLAGLGTVGRLAARRRTAAIGTAASGPDALIEVCGPGRFARASRPARSIRSARRGAVARPSPRRVWSIPMTRRDLLLLT